MERNASRANFCERAQNWKYGGLGRRTYGDENSKEQLSDWPGTCPRLWKALVNRVQTEEEEKAIHVCLEKAYDSHTFVTQAAARIKLKHTLRPRGSPKKEWAACPYLPRPLFLPPFFSSLVASTVAGHDPLQIGTQKAQMGSKSRDNLPLYPVMSRIEKTTFTEC